MCKSFENKHRVICIWPSPKRGDAISLPKRLDRSIQLKLFSHVKALYDNLGILMVLVSNQEAHCPERKDKLSISFTKLSNRSA